MKIHPTAIIENGAKLGDVAVGPYCHVGADVTLHDGVTLNSHVVVSGNTEIGAGTEIHAFAVLGGPPQHLQYKNEETYLKIGENTVIREHVTMHRGTKAGGGVTEVGAGGFFMAGAHVAHDCKVGKSVIFANNATLGGHVCVGDYAFLGGLSAIHQFARVGEYAFVGGCAAVASDIIPFGSAIGNHARLAGLNIVGLKRREFSRDAIRNLRAAYHVLFGNHDTFEDRLDSVRKDYSHCDEVMRVIEFIDAADSRPLMTPVRTQK